jgi:hypothetical protein
MRGEGKKEERGRRKSPIFLLEQSLWEISSRGSKTYNGQNKDQSLIYSKNISYRFIVCLVLSSSHYLLSSSTSFASARARCYSNLRSINTKILNRDFYVRFSYGLSFFYSKFSIEYVFRKLKSLLYEVFSQLWKWYIMSSNEMTMIRTVITTSSVWRVVVRWGVINETLSVWVNMLENRRWEPGGFFSDEWWRRRRRSCRWPKRLLSI